MKVQASIAESDDELDDDSEEEKRNSKKDKEEKPPAPHNVESPVFERTPSEAEVWSKLTISELILGAWLSYFCHNDLFLTHFDNGRVLIILYN